MVHRDKQTHVAVSDVSFDVMPRETLAIVGESGSGKTTTGRIAAKLIEPTSGAVLFEGQDITHASREAVRAFRADVQVVFQDPFSSLNPRHTVERIISAPLVYQRIKAPSGIRAYVRELMDRVGLDPDHCDRFPRQFSGGQAQRIGIARALSVAPKLIICDEPVSALDVSVQARILALLAELQRERDLSYVFISHDLAVVRQIADRIAVMSQGEIVEQGVGEQVFDQPRHEYTKALLSAIPRINPEWERQRHEWLASENAVATGEATETLESR